jgi:hypothetical protein
MQGTRRAAVLALQAVRWATQQRAGRLSAIASSENHIVKSPRRRRAALYAGQFVTFSRGFSNLWRRPSLCLYGMDLRGRKFQK